MHTGLRLDFKYLGHVSQLLQGGERAGGRAALPHQVGQVAMVAVAAVAVALGVAASPLLLGLKRTGKVVKGGRGAVSSAAFTVGAVTSLTTSVPSLELL